MKVRSEARTEPLGGASPLNPTERIDMNTKRNATAAMLLGLMPTKSFERATTDDLSSFLDMLWSIEILDPVEHAYVGGVLDWLEENPTAELDPIRRGVCVELLVSIRPKLEEVAS